MNLNLLRNEIDEIDWRILRLINKRFNLVQNIKKEKKRLGLQLVNRSREKKILKKLTQSSKELNLNSDFVADVYKLIIKESRRIQSQ